MLIAFFVASARCLVPDLCPSPDELAAAVRRRDNELAAQAGNVLRADDPDAIVTVHSERVVRIADLHCGEGWTADPGAVTCTYELVYPSRTLREVAKLAQHGPQWVIVDHMAVTLAKRRVR